ncbi:MAG: cytochrome P450 [Jatrophihabitans sp.]
MTDALTHTACPITDAHRAEVPDAVDTCPAPPMLATDRETLFDPPAALRALPPISPLTFAGGAQGWLVTEYRLARDVLGDARFSADRSLAESPLRAIPERFRKLGTPPGMFNSMDDPEHARYRKMLMRQFTVRRMNELQPRIETIVADTLDTLEARGGPVDLVQDYALPIPMQVICELLGVPYEFRADFTRFAAVLLAVKSDIGQLMKTVDELRGFLRRVIVDRRANPDGALLSGLIAENDLGDEELINIAQVLLLAGHETSANMLALGTFALLQAPDQLAILRADPQLMPSAVEELLRYLTIAHMGPVRAALEDVEVAGITIPKGRTVLVYLPVVNRDSELIDDGDRLDLERDRPHHMAFGFGVHQCIGQQLARAEMAIGFQRLFERFPSLQLAVPPEDVRMRTDMLVYGVHELPVTW